MAFCSARFTNVARVCTRLTTVDLDNVNFNIAGTIFELGIQKL